MYLQKYGYFLKTTAVIALSRVLYHTRIMGRQAAPYPSEHFACTNVGDYVR